MKGLVITKKGVEDVSLQEIEELISKKGERKETALIFEADAAELCSLCYNGRSFSRVLELLCFFEFSDLKDIEKKLEIEGFNADSFRVTCIRQGEHDFRSGEVEKIVGDRIDCTVDLKNPQKTVIAYVYENMFYLGIDYSGFDLGKRSYKIFVHPSSVRGDIAFAMLKTAGYTGKEKLVDPFCGCGTIPIEAALYSANKSVHFYDKEKFGFNKFMNYEFNDEIKEPSSIHGIDASQNSVIASRKNSKIAGISIDFLRADVDWLETRFEQESVDFLVTQPPQLSKRRKNTNILRAYEEFFNNASIILKPQGRAVLLTKDVDVMKAKAEKAGFKIKSKDINNQKLVVFGK